MAIQLMRNHNKGDVGGNDDTLEGRKIITVQPHDFLVEVQQNQQCHSKYEPCIELKFFLLSFRSPEREIKKKIAPYYFRLTQSKLAMQLFADLVVFTYDDQMAET